jgi:hypothetical protein
MAGETSEGIMRDLMLNGFDIAILFAWFGVVVMAAVCAMFTYGTPASVEAIRAALLFAAVLLTLVWVAGIVGVND